MTATPTSQAEAMATKSRQLDGLRANPGVIGTISGEAMPTEPTTESRQSGGWRDNLEMIVAIGTLGLGGIIYLDRKLDRKFTRVDGKIEALGTELRQDIKDQGVTTANSIEKLYISLISLSHRKTEDS
ncbi:hypothetical protein BO91_00205 [Candidatus Synechococcus spongiarum LMB bulk10E]|nr:hypothetical protein BO91_00205 [Candidatus Synechococcus spongiarum LMB bulk10E]OOV36722.1 hypothetical protein BO98_00685 [Candidatus Synechococcus spongiarum LMB bulk10D]